jgi:hypothetical protein
VSESRRKRVEDLDRQLRRLKVQLEDESERLETEEKRIASMRRTIEIEQSLFTTRQQEFNRKAITYEELEQENRILKTDLRNQVIASAKLAHDMKEQRIWQKQIDDKANELGRCYLKETRKWVERSLTQNNYASNKTRLEEAIA